MGIELIAILLLFVVFFTLLLLGIPIAISIGLATLTALCLALEPLTAFTTVAQRLASGLDSFALLAIPFFILSGELMNKGRVSEKLVDLAAALFSWSKTGLAFVNILSCTLFGAISGSAVAATSAIGGLLTPKMRQEGYAPSHMAAINLSSSSIGLIIPPSNIFIVYALASNGLASVKDLFLAGYIPGILMCIALMIVAHFTVQKNHIQTSRFNIQKLTKAFLTALPALSLLVVVVGGIIFGFFTATEGSVIAVLYAFALAFLGGVRTPGVYKEVILSAAKTSAMVLFLVANSMILSWFFAYCHFPDYFAGLLNAFADSPMACFLIINLILLLIGTFMDMTPAVLIFTPLFLPYAINLGIDPVHFGVVMVLNLCIGLCTPPIGTLLYVGSEIACVEVKKVIPALLPYLLTMVLILVLVSTFPKITLWLPSLF